MAVTEPGFAPASNGGRSLRREKARARFQTKTDTYGIAENRVDGKCRYLETERVPQIKSNDKHG